MITNVVESATTGALVATAVATPFLGSTGVDTLMVALHGALGGAARWIFLREDWKDGLRLMLLGGMLALGLGNLGWVLIDKWTLDLPDSILQDPRTAHSIAFFIGLISVVILGRIVDGEKE